MPGCKHFIVILEQLKQVGLVTELAAPTIASSVISTSMVG
jgi:hypothetical protein